MKYLPIGSIVLLKEGQKPVMIYSRYQLTEDNQEYDYLACLYPEGYINNEYAYLFNHTDIEKVIFEGYTDEKEEEYLRFIEDYKKNQGNPVHPVQ